jgi:selenocysteine-specific elongation factor
VLRDPSRRLVTGLVVLDVEPPPLRRRGAARLRADALAHRSGSPDARCEVKARGATTRSHLVALGALSPDAPLPDGVLEIGEFVVDPSRWTDWSRELLSVVDADRASKPLDEGLSTDAARRILGLPDSTLVVELVTSSAGSLVLRHGRISRAGAGPAFSDEAAAGIDQLRRRLAADPFDAPEAHDLAAAGLTRNVIAAAATAGLFLRLPGEILLLPDAADRAVEGVRALGRPFTVSEARQALGTTRRVAVPLLEHLDACGRTIRVDSTRRRVRD